MKYIFALLFGFFALSVNAALLPGTSAPDFTLQAAMAGKPVTVRLSEALQKGPVVLWFYPKAFTGGCTMEAHSFAEAAPQFTALGATIIGISADDLDVLKDFSVKECRNAFAVASDSDGRVVKLYEAKLMLGVNTAKRITYVIAPDGKVIFSFSEMSAKDHVSQSLAALKAWKLENTPSESTLLEKSR
jgi:peroxiredoxin